jgi:hypothetical protein
LSAQEHIRLEVFGGPSFNLTPPDAFSNWGTGWSFGGGIAYPIDSSLDAFLHVAFQHYSYRGGYIDLSYLPASGLNEGDSGNKSTLIEISAGARVSSSEEGIQTFASGKLGLYITKVGAISVTAWYDSAPNSVDQWTYGGTGVTQVRPFAALSLGFSFPVNRSTKVLVEGGIAQTFDSAMRFMPVTATLQYTL